MNIQRKRERCQALLRKYYTGVPTREDVLDQAVNDTLRREHRLLDAGCGSEFPFLGRYGPKVAFAVGVDRVEPVGTPNGKTAVVRGDLGRLPFRDGIFDVIISRSVLEHLERPEEVFREFSRLLPPGGKLIFTTPNKHYYSCWVASVIPFGWKDLYMRWMFSSDGYDHFPVYYRANTLIAFRRLARMGGFSLVQVKAIRHFPLYLMFSPLLFRLGVLYDRIITALRLDGLQSNWLVVMERTARARTR